MSATTYTYYREIYDVNALFQYVSASLPTLSSVTYNSGAITLTFPSALTSPQQTTLDGLITSYSNPQVVIGNNNYRQISVGNSSTTPLLANASYTGFFEDVSSFSTVSVVVTSDQAAAASGLQVQFSIDGATVAKTVSMSGSSLIVNVYSQYARVVYTNGAVNQTSFELQTIYSYARSTDTTISVAAPDISDGAESKLCRSVITGKTTNGTYLNMPIDVEGGLKLGLQRTAFDQLAVESMFPLVQLDFAYAINNETTVTTVTGIGSVAQSGNLAVLSSGTLINSSAALASRKSVRYRTGQGIRCMCTPVFAAPRAGNTQICGIGNSSDGFFFGYNGTAFGVLRRYNGADTWTPQTSWNADPMNGTGRSGMTLNPQLGNVYMIQFQWLGFGMITFYVEETTSGLMHPVHRIQFANTSSSTTLYVPYLNTYAASTNTTNATNVAMNVCCMAAFVEGNVTFNGPKFGVSDYLTTTSRPFVPVFSIRSSTTYAGKTNRISAYMRNVTVSSDTRQIIFALIKNPTLTGAVWSSVASNSIMQTDTTATALTGGGAYFNLCLGNSTGLSQIFQLYELSLEPGEILCCAVSVPTAQSTVACCALNWVEDC